MQRIRRTTVKAAVSALAAYTVVTACSAVALSSHDVRPVPVKETILEAEIVGTARVGSVTVQKSRCSTRTQVYLVPEQYLLGTLDQPALTFSYTVYEWKKAFWPWQEDCPSVHYTLPPIAEGMKEGDVVLFTAHFFQDHGGYFATGTIDINRLEEVKGLLQERRAPD